MVGLGKRRAWGSDSMAVDASILVVTGEPSGDLHLAGVIAEFQRKFPDREIRWFGSGGSRMAGQGAEVLTDVQDLAAIGPWAALANLKNYLILYRRLLAEAKSRKPNLAVLVDFPEFNLRLAPRLRALGIKVCYFIGPQVWAWRTSRVEAIRQHVDRMLVILPFEEEFYRSRGVSAAYVGNPSIGLRRFRSDKIGTPVVRGKEVLVALMPGSRSKEIKQILPVLLDAALELQRRIPCRFWLIKAPDGAGGGLEQWVADWVRKRSADLNIEVLPGAAAELLPRVDCAMIKSGTSTLEAMILEVPFVMVYRMADLSYWLLRHWVDTDVYCLANWVAGEKIVPEFVQDQANGKKIADCLSEWLRQPEKMQEMKQKLRNASLRLGTLEAYRNCADEIAQLLEDGSST